MDAYFMTEKNMMTATHSLDIKSDNSGVPNNTTLKPLIKKKKKKKICSMEGCQKKLNLISFSCKCSKKFCSIHRMPEDHSCSFDYKSHGKCIIAKKNPQIVKAKITHI